MATALWSSLRARPMLTHRQTDRLTNSLHLQQQYTSVNTFVDIQTCLHPVVVITAVSGLGTYTCRPTHPPTHPRFQQSSQTRNRASPSPDFLQHFAPYCKLFGEYLPLDKHRRDVAHCYGDVVQVGFVADSHSDIPKRRKYSMEENVRLKDFGRSVVVRCEGAVHLSVGELCNSGQPDGTSTNDEDFCSTILGLAHEKFTTSHNPKE